MAIFDDLTGVEINNIKVIRLLKKGKSHNTWEAICPMCNNIFTFVGGRTKLNNLYKCRKCNRRENLSTHGLSKTRIYRIYCSMKNRCYNENLDDYKNYGYRGIRICDEWLGKMDLKIFINGLWIMDILII